MEVLFLDSGYEIIIFLVIAIMFGPPLVLFIIGYLTRNRNQKTSRVMYILGVVYLIVGLGYCASLML